MVPPRAPSFARSLRSHPRLTAPRLEPPPRMSGAATKAPDSHAARNAIAISGSNCVPEQRLTSSAACGAGRARRYGR